MRAIDSGLRTGARIPDNATWLDEPVDRALRRAMRYFAALPPLLFIERGALDPPQWTPSFPTTIKTRIMPQPVPIIDIGRQRQEREILTVHVVL